MVKLSQGIRNLRKEADVYSVLIISICPDKNKTHGMALTNGLFLSSTLFPDLIKSQLSFQL